MLNLSKLLLSACFLLGSASLTLSAQANEKKGEWKEAKATACATASAGDACQYQWGDGKTVQGSCVVKDKEGKEGLYCMSSDKEKWKK